MIILNNSAMQPLFDMLDALPHVVVAELPEPLKAQIEQTARNGKQGCLPFGKTEITQGLRA